MRAVVADAYGPPEVLRIVDVERPAPKDDEVLVRVHASTVNRTDTGLRTAEFGFTRFFMGWRRPRPRLGTELAGEVVEVGTDVSEFEVGDRVFGIGTGTNAEFVAVRARRAVTQMPSNLGFEEAAALPDGGSIALAFLQQVRLEKGQSVLVYGASGSIGTASVQLARQAGAEVIAVCDTPHVEVVRSLGPDRVIDYLQEDVTAGGERFDVVLDAVGKLPSKVGRRLLESPGVYVTAGSPGMIGRTVGMSLITVFSSRKVRLGIARYRKEDVLRLKELVETGEYRPVIDRTYPLGDVIEAHRYVDTEQKTGNVVLTHGSPGG